MAGFEVTLHGRFWVTPEVYGHDQDLLNELELALRRWDIEPVILSERPNRGMTLVQKVEANAEVEFAFILLTPDDYGGNDIGKLQRRARQNVVWEWGYLVGRLARDRVCCLCKEGVEIPSDLHGIATINVKAELKSNLEEIRRELKAAAFHIP
jgi:predicted nucleotide-binding protein